jgi:DNA invertase Pin-like site-specific DNA recombinase
MSRSNSTNGQPTTPTKAVAYYRMSTDKQEDSISTQRSNVEPYAQKNGYSITRDYVDEGIGGDELTKRKEFQRMLRDAQAGAFAVILCDDKDRFGRFDAIDSGEIVAPLRRKGVRLVTVAQGLIDWTSFAGRITNAVLEEAKDMELTTTSRRVLSSQILKSKQGIYVGGSAAYGYRWEPDPKYGKKLVPDGRKAEVVQLVFKMYDEGHSLFAIAEQLYLRGVASPKGKSRWTRPVIQRLLSNRRYVGDFTWGVHPQGKRHQFTEGELRRGGRKSGLDQKTPRRAPQEHWIIRPDAHDRLIERDQFERVQARLKDRRGHTTPHPDGGNFVLSRLMVCGHCGSLMIGTTEYGHRNYVCRGYLAHGKGYCQRNWIREKNMVDALVRKLQEAFLDPGHIEDLRREVARKERDQKSAANLSGLRQTIASLDAKIAQGNERVLLLPRDADDRVPGLLATLRQWEHDRKEAQARLHTAETYSAVADLEKRIKTAEDILWRMQDVLTTDNTPLLRELLREVIARVELRWTHRHAGKSRVIRSQFAGAAVYLPATAEPSLLSPSGGPRHCCGCRARPSRTDRRVRGWRRRRSSPAIDGWRGKRPVRGHRAA